MERVILEYRVRIFAGLAMFLIVSCASAPRYTLTPDFMLSLAQGGCYFGCAEYRLTLAADGTVIFYPNRNTGVATPQTKQVPRETVERAVAMVREADVFTLDDHYSEGEPNCPSASTDATGIAIGVTIGGRTKDISAYSGCPDSEGLRRAFKLYFGVYELLGLRDWPVRDPEVDGRLELAESFFGCAGAEECARWVAPMSANALAFYERYDAADRTLLTVCRDGRTLLVSQRSGYIRAFTGRATDAELRAIESAIAGNADNPADAPQSIVRVAYATKDGLHATRGGFQRAITARDLAVVAALEPLNDPRHLVERAQRVRVKTIEPVTRTRYLVKLPDEMPLDRDLLLVEWLLLRAKLPAIDANVVQAIEGDPPVQLVITTDGVDYRPLCD